MTDKKIKKGIIKGKGYKKKKIDSNEGGFEETGSLIEERKGKCVICFHA